MIHIRIVAEQATHSWQDLLQAAMANIDQPMTDSSGERDENPIISLLQTIDSKVSSLSTAVKDLSIQKASHDVVTQNSTVKHIHIPLSPMFIVRTDTIDLALPSPKQSETPYRTRNHCGSEIFKILSARKKAYVPNSPRSVTRIDLY